MKISPNGALPNVNDVASAQSYQGEEGVNNIGCIWDGSASKNVRKSAGKQRDIRCSTKRGLACDIGKCVNFGRWRRWGWWSVRNGSANSLSSHSRYHRWWSDLTAASWVGVREERPNGEDESPSFGEQ
ncbi:hypothetical protein FRX31_024021 [Thalictrum thalictroides]|uniref:Uncharacterized protein n=1 Tax=Thalictrum thalictroides TaxID=46969 RepID=A0A7J6VPV2_THATH|nr:hypothetical protein FRX31_024021 [Thalictrum thalictroides]